MRYSVIKARHGRARVDKSGRPYSNEGGRNMADEADEGGDGRFPVPHDELVD